MENFSNDVFTILNYQGSKKNLLSFIHKNTVEVIDDKKAVFDIFAGSCAVGYSFKRYYKIDMPPESCASFKVSNQLVY